jgi:long-chain acyl-CoA synthetase
VALGDIVRRSARKSPRKVAIVDGARRATYAELDADVSRFANALLARGLQRGDRIATLCANSYEYAVAHFGIQRAGLVWLPINQNLAPADVAWIVGHAEPRLAVIDDALYAGPLGPVIDERVGDAIVVRRDPSLSSRRPSFDDELARGSAQEPEVAIGDHDLAQIMYTSGTTGNPKGVMHSHLSVFSALMANVIDYEIRASDVSNAMLPMFHCAQDTLVISVLAVGGTVVMMRSVDPGELLRTIAREKITLALTLPPIYSALLDHPARAEADLSSLRLCIYGMMQVPEPILRRLIAEICPNFQLGSGQTEMYPCTVTFKPAEQLRRIGPYWGDSTIATETAIMDDDGRLLPDGEIGEIVHRGPNVMLGYYKDPEATERSRAFGWHHTGDLGFFDPDGQLVFTDRKKDMIKTGGENVPSIKVERALLSHPAVLNAAAIGLAHPRWFEAVTGVVTLKPGMHASEEELLAHCRSQLSGFETPKAVCVVDQFPLTATGKIQKNQLRERFAALYAEVAAP